MRFLRRSRVSTFAVISLASRLAGLLTDALTGVADTLALVGLGLPVGPDLRGGLPEGLLVVALEVEAGSLGPGLVDGLHLRLHGRVERMDDLMGQAQVERELLAGHDGAVAHAVEVERDLVALADAAKHVRQQRPREPLVLSEAPAGASGDDLEALPVLLHLHVRVEGTLELALRALHLHYGPVDRDGYPVRDRNRALAHARDADLLGCFGHHQTSQRISPPTFCSRADLSDITPRDVDMIATPSPLWTFGMSR